MTKDTQQETARELSPADFRDLDLVELQVLADYITKNSVPVNMTMAEGQRVVNIYMDLLNLSLYNLNLLRNLAGVGNLPIPVSSENLGGNDA